MAEWEPLKLSAVINEISSKRIVLPVIQRDFVWDEDKMELLFDSLLKGNAFGGIICLVEQSHTTPLFAYRYFSSDGERQDSDLPQILDQDIKLIIDGQQRLQSFYMGLKGSVHGKKLYFNLFSQEEYDFEFAERGSDLPASMANDGMETPAEWYLVETLFNKIQENGEKDTRVTSEIIKSRNIVDDDLRTRVTDNVRAFASAIFDKPVIGLSKVTIDKTAPDKERRRMVELFRRLNDGGTRLSALDLAASTLKGFNPQLERFLRNDILPYADIGLGQDEIVRLLFLLRDNYFKEVTDIAQEDADFAVDNAQRILITLDTLVQFLKYADLYDYYHKSGRSAVPLFVIAYHIFHKNVDTARLKSIYVNYDANNQDFTNLKYWLYSSLLNGVFSKGKGWIPYKTGLRTILKIVARCKNQVFPTDAILNAYINHPLIFSREISQAQLSHWDMSFVFYLMYGCRSLTGRDIDHVQPKSLLSQAQVPGEKIHGISNYQLLDEQTNRDKKRAKELKDWIKDWDDTERKPYLARHLIPTDPELWSLDRFDEFLAQRSKLIVDRIRGYIPAPSETAQQAAQQTPAAPTPKKVYDLFGAAPISNQERDPQIWLHGVAERNGHGEDFRKLVAAAKAVGLRPIFNNNWWVAKFVNPRYGKRRNLMLYIGCDLWVKIDAQHIAEYLNCPVELVSEKMKFDKVLKHEDVDQWIENLHALFGK